MTPRLPCLILFCGLAACSPASETDPQPASGPSETQAPSLLRAPPTDRARQHADAQRESALTPDEMAAMAPPEDAPNAVPSIAAPDGPMLMLYSESAYQSDADTWMIDVMVGMPAYITAQLVDAAGEPVEGRTVSISTSRDSPLMTLASSDTDEIGEVTFGVRPNEDGEEIVTVRSGDEQAQITLNVIADSARQWQGLDAIEGVLRWETLLESQVRYRQDYTLDVRFSDSVKALDGEPVQLVGFMLPLEATDEQSHFLLVSTPPSCFFHVPGGPAGAVEVFSKRGVEVQWEPVMLSGRFRLVTEEGAGLIYQLEDAQLEALPAAAGASAP